MRFLDKYSSYHITIEELKRGGAKLIGQALLSVGSSTETYPSALTNTAQEVAQEAATSWVTDLQGLCCKNIRKVILFQFFKIKFEIPDLYF